MILSYSALRTQTSPRRVVSDKHSRPIRPADSDVHSYATSEINFEGVQYTDAVVYLKEVRQTRADKIVSK